MSKENVFHQKSRIAGRMADIAAEHLSGDAISEEHFREVMMLNMVHGVLAKEWEQRLLPAKLETIRQAVKDEWTKWYELERDFIGTVDGARLAILSDLQALVDVIDEA